MNAQEKIKKINEEIEKVAVDFEGVRLQKLAELTALEQERDARLAELNNERDMIALQEKLKDFPAKLIKEHATCLVCGLLMRPQKYVINDQVKKAWVCQSGDPNHDFIEVL